MLKNPPSLQNIISNINLGTIANNEDQTIREKFLQHEVITPWINHIRDIFIISEININSATIELTEPLIIPPEVEKGLSSHGLPCGYTFNISFIPLEISINWLLKYSEFQKQFDDHHDININLLSFPAKKDFDNHKSVFTISVLDRFLHQNLNISEQTTINFQTYEFNDIDINTNRNHILNEDVITKYLVKISFLDGNDDSFNININNIFTRIYNTDLANLRNNLTTTIISKLIALFPEDEQTIRIMFSSNYYQIKQNTFLNGIRFVISYLMINNQSINLQPLDLQFQLDSIPIRKVEGLITNLGYLPDLNHTTFIKRIQELNPQLNLKHGISLSFIPLYLVRRQEDLIRWYKESFEYINENLDDSSVFQVWLQAWPINGSDYSGVHAFSFKLDATATITPLDQLKPKIDLNSFDIVAKLGELDNNDYETIKTTIQRLNPDFNDMTNLDVISIDDEAIILQAKVINDPHYNGFKQYYSGQKKFTFTLKRTR